MKLYVGNLSFQTTSSELEGLFASIGIVDSATVVEDRETGRSRGFGFVEMATQEDAEKAIAELNGKEFAGREIKARQNRVRTVQELTAAADRTVGSYCPTNFSRMLMKIPSNQNVWRNFLILSSESA